MFTSLTALELHGLWLPPLPAELPLFVAMPEPALHLGTCARAMLERTAAERRRGAPRLRQALGRSDVRSESPWETLLRLMHLACDVPVEPQAEILAPDGSFIARADLRITGTRTL